jgi:hypothetical protein
VFDYIPDFAFIVSMDETTRSAVANMPEVVAVEFFHPAYKLNPELKDATGLVDLTVQTFPNAAIGDIVTQSETLGGQVEDISETEFGGQMRLTIDAARLPDLARIPGVRWIEPFYEPVLLNDIARSNTIMAAETAWNTLGLYGAGQIVAVADSGLDTGNLSTLHQDFRGGPAGCSGTGRIVATYALGRSGDWSDSCQTVQGENDGGHGTHVAGSVLGNGCRSGSNGQPNYGGSYAGLAPQASLVMQSVMSSNCGLGGIPGDLNQLFQQAYNAGARIHTNSWGANAAGQYTTDALNTDQFTWSHKGFAVLFSAGNEGVDASPRDGYVDADSTKSPATAKNAITVGASENLRPGFSDTWGQGWPLKYLNEPIKSDRLANNVNGMAAFSSRGPTDDGRIKPDVVAPGTYILSTKSQGQYVGGGWGAGPNQYYWYMGGTSMATPLTAGAVALIREFYTRINGVTPSAALLKATLINSAVNMHPGQYANPLEQQPPLPNNAQGWGRVHVANATDDTHQWQDISDANGLATNQSHTYTYPLCGTSPLKVTLVWTDYPGSTVASRQLVNDLDLTLTAPDGATVYRGNVFSNGWSTTGGALDGINNVESVYIQSPAAGDWTVKVKGYNVPNGNGGKQGYALVVDTPNNDCFLVDATQESVGACIPGEASYNVAVSKVGNFGAPVTLSVSGQPAGASASFSPNPVTAPGNSTLTIGNTAAAAPGSYNMTIAGVAGALTHQDSVTLNLSAGLPAAPVLTAPANGSTGQSTAPAFTWNAVPGAVTYDIQVATDPAFSNVVAAATGLTSTSYTPTAALAGDTMVYWRVQGVNYCGNRLSMVAAFRTQGGPVCTNVIGDGGFEMGRPNPHWSESSSRGYAVISNNSSSARTGAWFAWLGGVDNENSQAWQSPSIAASATSATLSYWYRISSTDQCNYDFGYLRINGVAQTTYDLCSSTDTGGQYVQATYDMFPYRGTSPEVRFQAVTDNSVVSSLRVDDVALNVCSNSSTIADYSDLASTYGVAWHTGNGVLRLGATWTADTAFGPDADSDDGVSFVGNFTAGQPATMRVNVQGTPTSGRWLRAWFDWDDNGIFDSGEQVYNGSVNSGDNDLSIAVPAGISAAVNYRARLYDSATAPAGPTAIDAGSYGGATGGEVEDGKSSTTSTCAIYDFNHDAVIDIVDISLVASRWMNPSLYDPLYDVAPAGSPDGIISIADIGAVAARFGQVCE